jgi:Uma2 family endonuclease
MSPQPRIGKLADRLHYFAHYGVRECWLIHQLTRDIEVLELGRYGVTQRQTFRGVDRIQSTVLTDFGLSPEVLSCW